jgi:hypothetical protein
MDLKLIMNMRDVLGSDLPVELDDFDPIPDDDDFDPVPDELDELLPVVVRSTFSSKGQLARFVTGPRPDVLNAPPMRTDFPGLG